MLAEAVVVLVILLEIPQTNRKERILCELLHHGKAVRGGVEKHPGWLSPYLGF
jgi:hypothetical protein